MLCFLVLRTIGEDEVAQIEDWQGNRNSSCSEDLDQGKIPREEGQFLEIIYTGVKNIPSRGHGNKSKSTCNPVIMYSMRETRGSWVISKLIRSSGNEGE
jgi:hypothetical protein